MATKAFLVGIDDYAPCGAGGPDLHGCVNDVRDMANTLVILGFDPRKIRILTNCAATKANILTGLGWLLGGVAKGDRIVFYYSGHGSQVPDTSGDEIDRRDEIICPHDINFANRVYISDDDLRAMFSRLPAGVDLEVILDSCHSGTGTREALAMGNLPEESQTRVRYLEPPLDMSFHLDYNPDLSKRKLLKAKAGASAKDMVIVPGLNHVLWAACRDNQTSTETIIGGVPRGAFTFNFCEVLRRTNGTVARKKVDALVTAALRRGGFAQVPQLEASDKEMLDKPFQ